MYRTLLLLLTVVMLSCSGSGYDEGGFPEDQIGANMAFKRMSLHGRMEPVLEDGFAFTGWQFYVASTTQSVVGNDPALVTVTLEDDSGIQYYVTVPSGDELAYDLEIGTYGFGTGTIGNVKRDLPAGEVVAEILLTEWEVPK
ncbi:hypothetical protein [Neolewinella antarctica]|uniref:Lipoprotein n=1 Tax=Neolewinella antarctica TaxID=442734 RepID=A0ABX0X6G3_9BACT|nr:hypothetical protein [Neolewinella antarctica]NJC24613.1 hypothetical protein [Neolewinella antarctica]